MNKMTWTMIRDTLASEIADGTLNPGDQLPTEPELVTRFGAGRHSVRRAIDALAREGKLSVEQGRGTFIDSPPLLTYSVGKRTRLRKNLLPHGYKVTGDLLGAEQIVASDRVAAALNLPFGAKVIESRRITYADDVPIAFGSVFHDAERFADIVERRDLLGSTTETYKSYGIDDYVRGETSMYARPAKPFEAETLRQHSDMPVMIVQALDTELGGRPLSYSKVIWAAGRVRFAMKPGDQENG
ncbi:MAG: phosphonate metabolism transcriptional regulator PhnF [Pseudomonadota bacterium]